MKIYTSEECEKWIQYKSYYPLPYKTLTFKPLDEEGNHLGIDILVADLLGKTFVHNQNRIKKDIEKLLNNYPQLEKILEKMLIFLCPKPEIGFSNAMCWGDKIVYWARTTQIPFCMTDYITAHELGHSIESKFCSRYEHHEGSLWREYLTLRNAPKDICKVYVRWDKEKEESIYEDREDFICLHGTQKQRDTSWELNPTEWFAEDFRYLFGVDTGETYWGLPIDLPNNKIKEFMMKLGI